MRSGKADRNLGDKQYQSHLFLGLRPSWEVDSQIFFYTLDNRPCRFPLCSQLHVTKSTHSVKEKRPASQISLYSPRLLWAPIRLKNLPFLLTTSFCLDFRFPPKSDLSAPLHARLREPVWRWRSLRGFDLVMLEPKRATKSRKEEGYQLYYLGYSLLPL